MERLTEVDICRLFCQLSDAMQYVHQRGLVHCAVSSHAVQLISTDCAKLTNFEYARQQDQCVTCVLRKLLVLVIIVIVIKSP